MGCAHSSVCDLCGKCKDEHHRYEDRAAWARAREDIRQTALKLRDGTQDELVTEEGPLCLGEQSVIAINTTFDPCDERYAVLEICLTGGVVLTKVVPLDDKDQDCGRVTSKKDD